MSTWVRHTGVRPILSDWDRVGSRIFLDTRARTPGYATDLHQAWIQDSILQDQDNEPHSQDQDKDPDAQDQDQDQHPDAEDQDQEQDLLEYDLAWRQCNADV